MLPRDAAKTSMDKIVTFDKIVDELNVLEVDAVDVSDRRERLRRTWLKHK
jgi:hypothetical protein